MQRIIMSMYTYQNIKYIKLPTNFTLKHISITWNVHGHREFIDGLQRNSGYWFISVMGLENHDGDLLIIALNSFV